MDNLPSEPQPIVSPKPPFWTPNKVLVFLIALLAAFIGGAGFYLLQSGQMPKLGKEQTQAPPSPTPGGIKPRAQSVLTFTGCSVKKEGNPLVYDAKTLSDGKPFSVLRGNISQIEFDNGKKKATIELIAPRGDQSYVFSVEERTSPPLLISDAATDLRELALSDLAPGQTVDISMNCYQDSLIVGGISVIGWP